MFQKAGVLFPELVKADRIQGDLLSQPDSPKSLARMAAIDKLNARYGRGTVRHAPEGFEHAWKLRAEMPSPCYTTRFSDLLRV